MELQKLHRERAVDAVYQALRQAILTHSLQPGERLNVDELAKKLGVSLTPIRGAIQQLATEGLVEIRPRSGTFVASLTARDIEETFDIRIALECMALEHGLTALAAPQVKRLRELSKYIRKPIRTHEDWESHERYNTEFHGILIQSPGNRRLQELYESLEAHLRIARLQIPEALWVARLQEEFAEHEAIIEAVESRDTNRCASALRKHIEHSKTAMLAALKHRIESNSVATGA